MGILLTFLALVPAGGPGPGAGAFLADEPSPWNRKSYKFGPAEPLRHGSGTAQLSDGETCDAVFLPPNTRLA